MVRSCALHLTAATLLSCSLVASPCPTDKTSLSRWFNAVRSHDVHAVDSLIRSGVDIDMLDRDGNTALMIATGLEWRDQWVVERLLAAGANVNVVGRHGTTALRNTVGVGGAGQDTLLFRLLLEHGADAITGCSKCCDRSVFLYACMWGTSEMVEALLLRGANVNAVDCKGRNALVHATEGRNAPVVALLLRSGADPKAADAKGKNVLLHAQRIGDRAILDLLKHAYDQRIHDGMVP